MRRAHASLGGLLSSKMSRISSGRKLIGEPVAADEELVTRHEADSTEIDAHIGLQAHRGRDDVANGGALGLFLRDPRPASTSIWT